MTQTLFYIIGSIALFFIIIEKIFEFVLGLLEVKRTLKLKNLLKKMYK